MKFMGIPLVYLDARPEKHTFEKQNCDSREFHTKRPAFGPLIAGLLLRFDWQFTAGQFSWLRAGSEMLSTAILGRFSVITLVFGLFCTSARC